jgi:hypothetical protein
MPSVTYFCISIMIKGDAPLPLYIQQDKSELILTVHGRLGGNGKEAHLDTPELAGEFRDAYLPRLQKRYGQDVKAEIAKCIASGSNINRTLQRIKDDSAMARKRIETGVLASNRRPE